MSQKKSVPTDEELSAMFEGIGADDDPKNAAAKAQAASKAPSDEQAARPPAPPTAEPDDDPFADVRDTLTAPRPSSRASTPHISSSATSVRKNTPPSSRSGRSSEEKYETTGDASSGPTRASQNPQTQQEPTAGAGWWGGWGGITSMATAAVKQARGAVEEIQKHEEAQKWAEQARGNFGALRGLGDDLRSRALPTFTSLLHTLAPPISQHERLQIHITHVLVNYPSLDPLIYQTFYRVMSQVEGGDLLVVQRGSESSQKSNNERTFAGSGSNGWNDGPWWRQNDASRDLGAVGGLVEGTKLTRVTAETYASEFYSARGGLEEAAKQATAVLSESNPVRSSDIFLAVQSIKYTESQDLFATSKDASEKSDGEKIVVDESANQKDDVVAFAIYLYDPVHSIQFSTLSQSFPQKWANWMDASSKASMHDGSQFVPQLPEEILEIISSGGVDPREWVAEWLEETISLAVGVVAQRYVARRMGVGEGGIGRGKRREEAVESNSGEAARAI